MAIRKTYHPIERALVVTVCVELALMPWAWGGMRGWSQLIAFGFSGIAFFLALMRRTYDDRTLGQTAFVLHTWTKLVRFPVFWLGLVFLAYVATQALNPAWIYKDDGVVFWIEKVDQIKWLPAGMQAPFDKWSPWRMLVIYATAWLTVCAVWVGLTRRRAFQTLFIVLAANGLLLAIVGILQRVIGNGKVLWLFQPSTSYFVATIPYKNHAATYFNLVLALAAGLSFWYHVRASRRLDRTNPSPFFAFAAVVLAVIVVFTFSRAGALLMAVLVLSIIFVFGTYKFRTRADGTSFAVPAVMLLLLGGFFWVTASSMRLEQVADRFARLFKQDRWVSVESREIVRHASWEMAKDRLVFGWGAGCYRFGFPAYQLKYDRISYGSLRERIFWEHAHSDYVEYLAELGIAGCALLLAILGHGIATLVRVRYWRNPLALLAVTGLAITLLHAWIDFPFQNPAILTTWAVSLYGLIRWTELDDALTAHA